MERAGVSPDRSQVPWIEELMVDIKNSAFLHTQFTEFVYMDSVSFQHDLTPFFVVRGLISRIISH